MKHTFFLFLCCLSITSFSFAQLDGTNQGGDKGKAATGILNAPAKEVNKPNSLEFGNDRGFKTAHNELEKKRQQKKKEQEFENKGIITPALRRKMTLQKHIEKSNFSFPLIDKDLGSFNTKSKELFIHAFDYGYYIDGDVISVYRNGKLIIENYTLQQQVKTLSVPLEIGFNKIEIVATHEGTYTPNTGSFTVVDDKEQVVLSDNWALAKGAKVIAMVIREE